jgi:hypothetical protein
LKLRSSSAGFTCNATADSHTPASSSQRGVRRSGQYTMTAVSIRAAPIWAAMNASR